MIWFLQGKPKGWTWSSELVILSCSTQPTVQLLLRQKQRLTWEPLMWPLMPMYWTTLRPWCLLGNDAWKKDIPLYGHLVKCLSWLRRMENASIWQSMTTSPTLILELTNALLMNVIMHQRSMTYWYILKSESMISTTLMMLVNPHEEYISMEKVVLRHRLRITTVPDTSRSSRWRRRKEQWTGRNIQQLLEKKKKNILRAASMNQELRLTILMGTRLTLKMMVMVLLKMPPKVTKMTLRSMLLKVNPG